VLTVTSICGRSTTTSGESSSANIPENPIA
jgi:hypothetical protein